MTTSFSAASSHPLWWGTFVASFQAVMTAATLASSGFYLHRRQMITSDGKKAMARFSQQLALPALYFTKIVACSASASASKQASSSHPEQDQETCPNMVLDNLNEVWILVVWPLYVVGSGLLLGELANYLCDTPAWYRKSSLAACAIGNSSSLPLALLAAIHLPSTTSQNGGIDPTVLLSIYFLLYPVLQWAMGSWLLSPDNHQTGEDTPIHALQPLSGGGEEDPLHRSGLEGELTPSSAGATSSIKLYQRKSVLGAGGGVGDARDFANGHDDAATGPGERKAATTTSATPDLMQVLRQVGMELFQPPAVGSLLGFLVSSIRPLRGLFVNLHRDGSDPLLSWLFRGLVVIGQAAVPLGMAILGAHLSAVATANPKFSKSQTAATSEDVVRCISQRTILGILVSKMILMPIVGIGTVWIFKTWFWKVPTNIAPSLYLVMMIETITPTANSVMVMVELFGSSKEQMARIIGWQYAVAPILLSITVTMVVHIASQP